MIDAFVVAALSRANWTISARLKTCSEEYHCRVCRFFEIGQRDSELHLTFCADPLFDIRSTVLSRRREVSMATTSTSSWYICYFPAFHFGVFSDSPLFVFVDAEAFYLPLVIETERAKRDDNGVNNNSKRQKKCNLSVWHCTSVAVAVFH